jgi:hypothetical protein
VKLEAGQQLEMTFDVQLPPTAAAGYRLLLVPFSRVRATDFEVNLTRGGGRAAVRYAGPLIKQVTLTDERRR